MNDLDLLRTMRADAPVPSPRRLDAGRERLLAAIDSTPVKRPTAPAARRLGGRVMLIAGGVTAVAAAAALAAQMGGHPATVHSSPAAQYARYTDPLVERATFGWLPPGMHAGGYVADHQGQGQPEFFQVTAYDARTRATVTLTTYRRGQEPALGYLPGGVPAKRIPTRAVNGHPAYWIFAPNPSGQSSFKLRWEYAPKTWADLEGVGLRGRTGELTRIAYTIARSATLGGTRPIALPLHVDGVPGGLTPKRTVLNTGAYGQVGADLAFIVAGPSDELSISVARSNGTVGTGTPDGRGVIRGHPRPNTTLDGHPAYRSRALVYVYRVNGFDVMINASGSILARLDRTGGVAGLFHRTTVLGGDRADWTTNPVN